MIRIPPMNRVYVKNYGSLQPDDPRLIPVASIPGKVCKLHYLAAAAFTVMCAACYAATGIRLVAASGYRPHGYRTRDQYEAKLLSMYSKRLAKKTASMTPEKARAYILAYGRARVAFNSAHETGLAVDFGSGGLTPDTLTAEQQYETEAYAWLAAHAHEYGWTPYDIEPWHWEFNIPKADWERV